MFKSSPLTLLSQDIFGAMAYYIYGQFKRIVMMTPLIDYRFKRKVTSPEWVLNRLL